MWPETDREVWLIAPLYTNCETAIAVVGSTGTILEPTQGFKDEALGLLGHLPITTVHHERILSRLALR
jgi:hypothetical protein